MDRKRSIVIILLIIVAIAAGGAIYVGYKLQQEPDVTPETVKALAGSCSCEAGNGS